MSELNTIVVSATLKDRLKLIANIRGKSIREVAEEYLTAAAEEFDRRERATNR